jgi:hypothetical protein
MVKLVVYRIASYEVPVLTGRGPRRDVDSDQSILMAIDDTRAGRKAVDDVRPEVTGLTNRRWPPGRRFRDLARPWRWVERPEERPGQLG